MDKASELSPKIDNSAVALKSKLDNKFNPSDEKEEGIPSMVKDGVNTIKEDIEKWKRSLHQ